MRGVGGGEIVGLGWGCDTDPAELVGWISERLEEVCEHIPDQARPVYPREAADSGVEDDYIELRESVEEGLGKTLDGAEGDEIDLLGLEGNPLGSWSWVA